MGDSQGDSEGQKGCDQKKHSESPVFPAVISGKCAVDAPQAGQGYYSDVKAQAKEQGSLKQQA